MSVNTYNSSLNKLINIAGGGEGANFKAMYDKTTALYAHAIDDIIYVDNHFYKVTSAIAIGDTITVGTNVEEAELSPDMAIYIENLPSAEGEFSADQVGYDNTTSGLTADNVQDAIDEVNGKIKNYTLVNYTILAANWSNGTYSLESLYPSTDYDILNVVTNDNTTSEMREAWAAADCGGYRSTNVIKAHGTIPTIDIAVTLMIVPK